MTSGTLPPNLLKNLLTFIENILKITMKSYPGKITSYELGILGKDDLILPCGVCARYEK